MFQTTDTQKTSRVKKVAKDWAKDCSGQFSVLFAITASVVMLAIGVAVDTGKLHKMKNELNHIADSAALAGAVASEQGKGQRVQVVQDYITANSSAEILALLNGKPKVEFDDGEKQVTVSFSVIAEPLFGKLLQEKTVPVGATSIASYGQQSIHDISIAFALDVSGSMAWNTSDGDVKIDVLKESVKFLFNELEAAVESPEQLEAQLRTSMSAYNTSVKARSAMNWGWQGLDKAVGRLSANGGTNSTASLKYAHDQIVQDRQFRKIYDPAYNSSLAKEFVVFMTDGDNNQDVWDDNSYAQCVKMRKDGIEIYSIAFAAPEKGQALLMDCASPDGDADMAASEMSCRLDIMASAPSPAKGMELCQSDIMPSKQGHYFDAEDADAFKKAFSDIGREIVERGVRIKA